MQEATNLDRARLLGTTRRHFFAQCGMGLGSIALGSLLADEAHGASDLPWLHDPLAPRAPHFAPARARHLSVHGWRSQPIGPVRLQTQAARARWPGRAPLVHQEQAIRVHQGGRQAFGHSPQVRPPRPIGRRTQRAAAAPGHRGRRRMHRQKHGHRRLQSRARQAVRQHRLQPLRPAQHGRLAHLRHRQRVARSTRFRRVAIGPAVRAAAIRSGAAASSPRPTRACRSCPARSQS